LGREREIEIESNETNKSKNHKPSKEIANTTQLTLKIKKLTSSTEKAYLEKQARNENKERRTKEQRTRSGGNRARKERSELLRNGGGEIS